MDSGTRGGMAGMAYEDGRSACSHGYVFPEVLRILDGLALPPGRRRVFDLGCGNGAAAAALHERGYEVAGVDPSPSGIEAARATHPGLRLAVGSSADDLARAYGRFPVVVSLEVIEHVYAPRELARCVLGLLEDGGTAIFSTPYHGYWKNLALALTGRLDRHFTALWDGGHIKFWSRATLTELLRETGFEEVRIVRVGRIPPLARSMVAIARRPGAAP